MEIIINVKGMVCEGCEKRVKNAVMDIDGVENVEANYKDGTVKVTVSKEIDKKIIEDTIVDIGFEI